MNTINLNPPTSVAEIRTLAQAAATARRELGVLDNHLLTLRLNLGKLRAAFTDAFAPLTAAAMPVVNSAIRALTDFCDDAGAVMSALFGTVRRKAVTTTRVAGAAIRRTLASFDQINRLNAGSGSGGSTSSITFEPINDPLTPELEGIVFKIRSLMDAIHNLLAPLGRIDLTPAAQSFAALGQTISGFAETVAQGLGWAWHNLLVPLASWAISQAVPATVDLLRSALELLTAACQPLLQGIRAIQPALEPVAAFLSQTLTRYVAALTDGFSRLTALLHQWSPQWSAIFANLSQCVTALWGHIQQPLTGLREFFLATFQTVLRGAESWLTHMLSAFSGLTEFLAGVLTGDWARAWEGLKTVLKGAVNAVIGLLNSLLSGLASGLNGITAALNKWHVDIPNWVPLVGGKTFGFNLKAVTAPQIPYLAQGAVLPPNKPFLAMVGDQRHGTNIEAPISTIQEALGEVLRDLSADAQGSQSVTQDLLSQILDAVLSIRIGDDAIADACRRSQTRRAIMEGGGYAF